nr:serine/threonine-protein kinase pakG-like [Dermatophagoides farinae]
MDHCSPISPLSSSSSSSSSSLPYHATTSTASTALPNEQQQRYFDLLNAAAAAAATNNGPFPPTPPSTAFLPGRTSVDIASQSQRPTTATATTTTTTTSKAPTPLWPSLGHHHHYPGSTANSSPIVPDPFKSLQDISLRAGLVTPDRESIFSRYSLLNSSGGGASILEKLNKEQIEKLEMLQTNEKKSDNNKSTRSHHSATVHPGLAPNNLSTTAGPSSSAYSPYPPQPQPQPPPPPLNHHSYLNSWYMPPPPPTASLFGAAAHHQQFAAAAGMFGSSTSMGRHHNPFAASEASTSSSMMNFMKAAGLAESGYGSTTAGR